MDKRQRWVANYVLQKGAIKAKDVSAHFNVDEKTARSWLHNWVDEGFVIQKGCEAKLKH